MPGLTATARRLLRRAFPHRQPPVPRPPPPAPPPAPPALYAVELRGGLGNQLFQYAAARALALRAGVPLLLDATVVGGDHTPRAYALEAFAVAGEVAHDAASLPAGLADHPEPGMPFDPAVAALPPGTRLRGFFQSELYFRDAAPALRQDLRPVRPFSARAAALRQRILSSPGAIAVQVRRGDMAADPAVRAAFGLCGAEYYRRGFAILRALGAADGPVFVFSDDAAAAAALIEGIAPSVAVQTGTDWEDLLLMGACRHHLIANSTFGWWGAWLAGEQGALVAPRRWFGAGMLRQHNTCDLLPARAVLA